MNGNIDLALIDWSRAQFALTAMYHWLFVPLTLGLGVIMAIMETIYHFTDDEFWKRNAKFWMRLFGINFAIGVATGIILEFEFGTNWSNYSWFVGDIFGAPLAIEGIMAFFMEATFIAVMYFGWEKVSRRFHLASTWLTITGATLSAWWILVANAWMQNPVGMVFNPDTMRNEMVDFWAVAFSPVAVNKFFHTVISSWIVGSVFVVGVSGWYLLKQREVKLAKQSIKVAGWFGLLASLLTLYTGDSSAYLVSEKQPMKLAAMEALYEGKAACGLVAFGILNPDKESYNDQKVPIIAKVEIPKFLSLLAKRDANAFVPGIKNLIDGYEVGGKVELSAQEKIKRGQIAIAALANYRKETKAGNHDAAQLQRNLLMENFSYFGYGYVKDPKDLIPHVGITFYAFRVMVILGTWFILLFAMMLFFAYKENIDSRKWLLKLAVITIPMAYIASQAGWVVAELGRQPWTIQDVLPTNAAVSRIDAGNVALTFWLFVLIFTVLLVAEVRIMVREIKKGA